MVKVVKVAIIKLLKLLLQHLDNDHAVFCMHQNYNSNITLRLYAKTIWNVIVTKCYLYSDDFAYIFVQHMVTMDFNQCKIK